MKATTSGDIVLNTSGTLNVNQAGQQIVAANGNITLTADDMVISQAINGGTKIVTLQPFSVPADGPDILQNFVIPIPLDEDKLVAAIELQESLVVVETPGPSI